MFEASFGVVAQDTSKKIDEANKSRAFMALRLALRQASGQYSIANSCLFYGEISERAIHTLVARKSCLLRFCECGVTPAKTKKSVIMNSINGIRDQLT